MKKKIFSLLLAVCVMFTFMPTMAFAANAETDIVITAEDASGNPVTTVYAGDTITVKVKIPAFDNYTTATMDIRYTISGDAEVTPVNIPETATPFEYEGLDATRSYDKDGKQVIYSVMPKTGSSFDIGASEITEQFTVSSNATKGQKCTFTIDVDNTEVANTEGNNIATFDDATKTVSVTIADKPAVADQTITFDDNGTATTAKSLTYKDAAETVGVKINDTEITSANAADYGELTIANSADDVVTATLTDEKKIEITPLKAGTANITVSAAAVDGKYNANAGTVLAVTVNPKTVTNPTFEGISESYELDGYTKPTFTLKDGADTIPAEEYDVTYNPENPTEACEVTIVVTDKDGGNYTVSGQTTFNVVEKTIGQDVMDAITAYKGTYDATAHDAVIVGAAADGYTVEYKAADATDFTADMPKVTNVADAKAITVKVSKAGYTANTKEVTPIVTAKDMSSAVITLAEAPVYSGTEQAIDFTVGQVDGLTLTDADYNVTGNKATNVESTTLTLTGKGNFTGTATTSWTLKQATPTAADFDLPATGEFTYSGSAVALSQLKVKDGITGMGDTTIYIKDAEGNDATEIKNVGTYTITFNVANGTNYSAATDLEIGRITITAKQLTITATAADRAYEAGKTEVDVTLALTGIVDGDEVALAETAVKGTMADANVGTDKAVTVTAAPELTGAAAGNYTLDTTIPAVTVNITAVNYAGTTAHTEKANAGAKVSCDLAKDFALPAGETFTFGEIVVADADSIFDSAAAPALADGKVTFTINKSAAVGKTATITIPVTSTNYNAFDLVITVEVTKKTTSSGGGGGSYIPVQKPTVVADSNEGKVDLSSDGSTATITPKDGFEIDKVTVNGTDKGAVDKVTGLKTGDKLEVTFKAKDTFDVAKYVADLQLVARSSKTAKGNVKVTVTSVTDLDGKVVDLSELTAKGYKVQYKFYRSEKKASKYAAKLTKDITDNSYVNTQGTKGTKYFYKVRVLVFNGDELVAQTELKQCKYASRTWSK